MTTKTKAPQKLFSLKEWLTLEDAAKHLSLSFGEAVTVADVLRLGLDRRLTLSVWFLNHTYAKKGRLMPLSECKMLLLPGLNAFAKGVALPAKRVLTHDELRAIYPTIKDQLDAKEIILTPSALHYSDNDEWLVQEDDVKSIKGIWDLPMVGGEALHAENLYQMQTDGPEVTLTNLEGAFVVKGDVVCQLHVDFEDNEYQPGSLASLEALRERIDDEEIDAERAEAMLAQHRLERVEFLKRPRSYYPASGLPDDAVWVVRTAALRAFEEAVVGNDSREKKSLGRREETTLLNIAAGLLNLLLSKTPAGKPQSVFRDQAAVIDALLAAHEGRAGIAKRTLEKKFAQAKRSLSS